MSPFFSIHNALLSRSLLVKFLLLLHCPAVSLGFTILGEIFVYVTVLVNPTVNSNFSVSVVKILMFKISSYNVWHEYGWIFSQKILN